MGKYIVEMESGTHIFVLGPEGIVHIGEPDVVYETVDGMQIGDAVINAKPYAEPDLEQVRKEAYQKGYETGYEDGYNEPGKNQQEAYQRGLNDAWDAARKIIRMPEGDLLNIFPECYSAVCTALQVFLKYDASECIEKIQAYEQEEIKVGDEVVSENDIKAVVIDMDDYLLHVLDENGVANGWPREDVVKTGRHFPEIAIILEKMRGEQDG